MDFTHPTTVEELIISSLQKQSQTGVSLLALVRTRKHRFTKQALYVILRKLLASEIIVKHGRHFSLAKPWISKMSEFFTLAQQQYEAGGGGNDFVFLSDGDRISYNFKSPSDADQFWGHAFDVLSEKMSHTEPVYIYNPHDWFVLTRHKREMYLMQKLKNEKRSIWITVGHATPLDLYSKRFFDGNYIQYHAQSLELFKKEYYYINIFGTFVIEASLDVATADAIHAFYTANAEWNLENEQKLRDIVSRGKTKITISNNSRKATKLKKMLGRNFFIPK